MDEDTLYLWPRRISVGWKAFSKGRRNIKAIGGIKPGRDRARLWNRGGSIIIIP